MCVRERGGVDSACVRESGGDLSAPPSLYLCVCVREREREFLCVRVCERGRESGRDREEGWHLHAGELEVGPDRLDDGLNAARLRHQFPAMEREFFIDNLLVRIDSYHRDDEVDRPRAMGV